MDGYVTTLTGREQFDYIFSFEFCSIVSIPKKTRWTWEWILASVAIYNPMILPICIEDKTYSRKGD